MARWLRLRGLRPRWWLAAGRWALRCSGCGGRSSVTVARSLTGRAHGMVQCLLAVRHGQRRDLGAELKRTLEIGSYQTAWAMLHRLRSVLVRRGRDRQPAWWRWMRPTSAVSSRGWQVAGPGARRC